VRARGKRDYRCKATRESIQGVQKAVKDYQEAGKRETEELVQNVRNSIGSDGENFESKSLQGMSDTQKKISEVSQREGASQLVAAEAMRRLARRHEEAKKAFQENLVNQAKVKRSLKAGENYGESLESDKAQKREASDWTAAGDTGTQEGHQGFARVKAAGDSDAGYLLGKVLGNSQNAFAKSKAAFRALTSPLSEQ